MKDDATGWDVPREGLWGFSHCAFFDTWYPWTGGSFESRLERLVGDLVESGANSWRPQIHWHQVERTPYAGPLTPDDVTAGDVEEYSDSADWSKYDRMVDALVEAGIVPHLVVGAAYDFQLPAAVAGGQLVRATPDAVGRDRYLARLYLHSRAVARRYRGKVRIWQLENELNAAGETMLLVRWRSGRAWLDFGFLTAVIEVISRAVAEEDPGALRSHNFQAQWRLIPGIYHWHIDVEKWLGLLDVVGVDAYPNYVIGWPSMGSRVGRKVKEAVELSGGRPVMVLESGYPVKPRHRGMSEGRQAEFVRDAIASTVEAGGVGYYYYMICSPEGYPVEGPWSNRYFQSIEPWWGLVRTDDTKRPAFFAFQEAVAPAKVAAASSGAD